MTGEIPKCILHHFFKTCMVKKALQVKIKQQRCQGPGRLWPLIFQTPQALALLTEQPIQICTFVCAMLPLSITSKPLLQFFFAKSQTEQLLKNIVFNNFTKGCRIMLQVQQIFTHCKKRGKNQFFFHFFLYCWIMNKRLSAACYKNVRNCLQTYLRVNFLQRKNKNSQTKQKTDCQA